MSPHGLLALVSGAIAAALLGCDPSGPPSAPDGIGTQPGPQAPAPIPAPAVARLYAWADTIALFPGSVRRIHLEALGTDGKELATDEAVISLGGTAAASIAGVLRFSVRGVDGRLTAQQSPLIRVDAPGHVVVRVSLRSVETTIDLNVSDPPPPSTALAVDSFYVVEYRIKCAGDCPYLAYVPVLKLREPTRTASVTVVGVEFSIPGMTTGMCRGDRVYGPGAAHHLNGQFEYPWSNDLMLVMLDGTPVPLGDAGAEVLIREASGAIKSLRVRGPILRMVPNPVFAEPVWPDQGWECWTTTSLRDVLARTSS